MQPTEMAKIMFSTGSMFLHSVVESGTASEDMKNLAAGMRNTADGLNNMAVGLRATYMLLEKVEKMLAEQSRRAAAKP